MHQNATASDARTCHPELASFYTDRLIRGEPRLVKSGKEATVYCCDAEEWTGVRWLAAKIYRGRNDRTFRNDAVYQEGRVTLDRRSRRALEKKSRFGREVQAGGWLVAEWETLDLLHRAGADVPRPVALAEEAMLMEYIGEEDAPAMPLHRVRLEPGDARRLFVAVMRNVELMLRCDRVHADLSAYNILLRDGAITIIDVPQAVDPRSNPAARTLLERDIANVCRYFERQGFGRDATRIADDLWGRYERGVL